MAKIDEDFYGPPQEVGFCGKVLCFVEKYKKRLCFFAIIMVVFAVFSVLRGVFRDAEIKNMQKNFLALDNNESRLGFIKKYGAKPLCGIVLLELADEALDKKNFELAIGYYNGAAKALGKNELAGRAMIFSAVSEIKCGNLESGLAALDKIARNGAVCIHFRADALEKYVGFAMEAKETKRAAEAVNYAKTLPISSNWKNRIIAEI